MEFWLANYQVGNVVLGIEGDFEGWTVGKIRYTVELSKAGDVGAGRRHAFDQA
jgi:hypothetical protein